MSEQTASAARWRKSSFSGGSGTDCVEVAAVGANVATRDSKDPSGPVLGFSGAEWGAFLAVVKRGAYDLS